MKPRTFVPNNCAGCGYRFRGKDLVYTMTFTPAGLHIGYVYPLCTRCRDNPSPEMVRRVNEWLVAMNPELKALPPGPTGVQTFDFQLPTEMPS